jgi:hypothetical protein
VKGPGRNPRPGAESRGPLPTVDLRAVDLAERTAPEKAKLREIVGVAAGVQEEVRAREDRKRREEERAAEDQRWREQAKDANERAIAAKAEALKRGELKPPEPAPKRPAPEPEYVGYDWYGSASGAGRSASFYGGATGAVGNPYARARYMQRAYRDSYLTAGVPDYAPDGTPVYYD